ncbi:CHAD domain-containing protein [Kitasatospora gansuensis]
MTDLPTTTERTDHPAPAGEVLEGYLNARAGAFLRALPLAVGEAGSRTGSLPSAGGTGGGQGVATGTGELLRCVRRIGGALHTFSPVFEPVWAEETRTELRWLSGLLAQEPGYVRRSARLLAALDSLSETDPARPGMLAGHAGAPKARALMERQLTLARTRAHTALLQELRSARLHALADRMTLLAGEVPVRPEGAGELRPRVAAALELLAAGVATLPPARAPYGGEGLHRLGAVAQGWRRTPTRWWRWTTRRGTGCGSW